MSENRNGSPDTPRRVPRPASPAIDGQPESVSLAEAEKQDLERKRSEHSRDQTSRWILARGMWVLVIAVFVIVIGAISTLAWHHLLPEELHWLGKAALEDIKNIVLSGAVVGLGTTYMRRYFEGRA